MSYLTDQAAAQLAARVAAEQAAADAAKKALRTAALDAVRLILVRQDGTTMTLAEAGLSAVLTDLDHGLVVVSDGTVSLAAVQSDGSWVVSLAISDEGDNRWRVASDPLHSLADLGAALKVVA